MKKRNVKWIPSWKTTIPKEMLRSTLALRMRRYKMSLLSSPTDLPISINYPLRNVFPEIRDESTREVIESAKRCIVQTEALIFTMILRKSIRDHSSNTNVLMNESTSMRPYSWNKSFQTPSTKAPIKRLVAAFQTSNRWPGQNFTQIFFFVTPSKSSTLSIIRKHS